MALALGTASGAAEKEKAKPKRVRPPQWSQKTLDLFYPDARQKLVGPKPSWRVAESDASQPEPPQTASQPAEPTKATAPAAGWSKLIAADILENEVKSSVGPLEVALGSSSDFKGGGFKEARERLSVLAAVFSIIADYDGDVRWQRQAKTARETFARAGLNAKVASDGALKEALARLEDLAALLQGGNVAPAAAGDAEGSELTDRPSLMARMERGETQFLRPAAANAAEFKRLRDKVRQEAQVLAALARLIRGDSYEYADDATYLKYAEALEQHAHDMAVAAEKDRYQDARKAAAAARKTCNECHSEYRS